jgi:hypothetical protein
VPIWLALAGQVAAAAVTPADIGRLPPVVLGERLLGPTRLPIVEAYRYGEPLEPPPPPGQPTVVRIRLFERARESGEPGFCEKVRYMVRLRPVITPPSGETPPSTVDTVTPSTLYRWHGTDPKEDACEGPSTDFFDVRDADMATIFGEIRHLAATQQALRAGAAVAMTGTVDDALGRAGHPAEGVVGPITDWRAALMRFPVSAISQFWKETSASGPTLTFRAREWTLEWTQPWGGSGNMSVTIRRFIPPPA